MAYRVLYGYDVITVPSTVVEHFLKLANEQQLKVLLSMLQTHNETITAEVLGMSATEVSEALEFWVRANVLQSTEQKQIGPLTIAQPSKANCVTASEVDTMIAKGEESRPKARETHERLAPHSLRIDPSDIAREMYKDKSLKELCSAAESMYGKTLTFAENRTLLWIHSYLALDNTVVFLLMHYAVAAGKTSMQYLEKVAWDWADRGITTSEQAEVEILQLQRYHGYEQSLLRELEHHRPLSINQKKLVEKWQRLGYSIAIVKLAYQQMLDNAKGMSFPYVDKVLANWTEKGLLTPEQIQADAEKFREKRSQQQERKARTTTSAPEDFNKYLSVINHYIEEG